MIAKHRIETTEAGLIIAGFRLMEHNYSKFSLERSGNPERPFAIMLDADEKETFDFLRPDILPPKKFV